jgi:hypothetical protein
MIHNQRDVFGIGRHCWAKLVVVEFRPPDCNLVKKDHVSNRISSPETKKFKRIGMEVFA